MEGLSFTAGGPTAPQPLGPDRPLLFRSESGSVSYEALAEVYQPNHKTRRSLELAEPRPGRNRGRRRRSAELTRARRRPGRPSTGVLDDLQRAGSAHNLDLDYGDRRSWPGRRPGRLSTGVLDDLQRAGSAHNLGLGRGDRWSWPDRRPGPRRSAELARSRRRPGLPWRSAELARSRRRPGLPWRSAELARSSPWGAGRTSTRAQSRTPAIGGAGQVVALGRWQNLDQGAIEDAGDRRSWPGRRPGALAEPRPASWRACSAPAQITTST